jgi:copper chaperone CopZ
VVEIQTSGKCQGCKNKIERGLTDEKGVKTVEYDLATAIVKVTYNVEETNVETLRLAINKLGFVADGQKPDIQKSDAEKKEDCQQKKDEKAD